MRIELGGDGLGGDYGRLYCKDHMPQRISYFTFPIAAQQALQPTSFF